MKVFLFISRAVFVLCIPLFIFSLIVGIAFNCVPLYEYGFEKYDANTRLGFSDSELTRIAKELISYYVSGDEYLDIRVEIYGDEIDLFNREELIHMKDVKGLVQLDYRILGVTLVYLTGYCWLWLRRKKPRRELARSVLAGSVFSLAIMLALWLGSLWDFDWLFLRFHYLAFSNHYWSAEGYMLKLFPGGFWYDITLYCAIAMALLAAAAAGTAGMYLYRTGKGLLFYRVMS